MMKIIPIIQLGIGNVGREVIRNVLESNEQDGNRAFRYIGIANSKSILFRKEGIPERILNDIRSSSGSSAAIDLHDSVKHNGDLSPLLKNLDSIDFENLTLIDTTDSHCTTSFLLQGAKRGFHLVLANKKPLVEEMSVFRELNQTRLGCRATVGAGLPVIPSIQNLKSGNEKIMKVEGCLSGSLGILCTSLEKGFRFSEIVMEIMEKRYTEPDPREDLSGVDMARKILIIARLCGQETEFREIAIESLFPEKMAALPVQDFILDMASLDDEYAERFRRARHDNSTLRYVASFEKGKCMVGLQEVSRLSDIGRLEGAEKLVLILTSERKDHPLVIKGAGAGAVSAARDVLDDLRYIS